jgi:hypothetical protein
MRNLRSMNTIASILAELGGTTEVARKFDPPLPITTVSAWKSRGHIPFNYWPKLAAMSEGKLTESDLLAVHLLPKREAAE